MENNLHESAMTMSDGGQIVKDLFGLNASGKDENTVLCTANASKCSKSELNGIYYGENLDIKQENFYPVPSRAMVALTNTNSDGIISKSVKY